MQNISKYSAVKRYATAAIVIGGSAVLGGCLIGNNHSENYGMPFYYDGQQYYLQNDSKRAIYPSYEACINDVPSDKQSECEPVADYSATHHNAWYGPIYSPRDDSKYRPSSQYPTETVSSSNFGKKLPSNANKSGFGANGKAFTGSAGS